LWTRNMSWNCWMVRKNKWVCCIWNSLIRKWTSRRKSRTIRV
jgi:hypothetical protein